MRLLFTKFSLVFFFFLLSFSNSPIAKVSSVNKDLATKDKTKETTNPIKPRSEVGGKNDRPKKDETFPSPIKKKAKVLQIPPTILNEEVRTTSLTPSTILSKRIQPIQTNFNKIVGPDPFRFSITSNKDSIAIGEEIELTITVDWVDYGVNNGVRFLPEWYKYNLRVVTPKGFLQTGGDYTDFCTKPVDANNPQAVFTIKGLFEYAPDETKFTVLRGFEGADERSEFIWKEEKKIQFYINLNKRARNASACTCSPTVSTFTYSNPSDNNYNVFFDVNEWGAITSNCPDAKIDWYQDDVLKFGDVGQYVQSFTVGQCYSSTIRMVIKRSCGNIIKTVVIPRKIPFSVSVDKGLICAGSGDEVNISTSGCVGTITWENKTWDGNKDKPTISREYKAKCTVPNVGYCESSDRVTVIGPEPILNASKYKICEGEEVTLTGGCAEGVLTWVGQSWTGNIVTFRPSATAKYKVGCTVRGCYKEVEKTIEVGYQLPEPTIERTNQVCSVKLTAQTTESGVSYQWVRYPYSGNNETVGTDSYYVLTDVDRAYYKLIISKTGCLSNSSPGAGERITSMPKPSAPSGTSVSPTSIPEGTLTTITLGGTCPVSEGSTLQWSLDNGSSWTTGTAQISTATTFDFRCRVNANCISNLGTPRNVTTNTSVSVTTVPNNASNCGSTDGSIVCTAQGGSGSGYQYILYANDGATVIRDYQTSNTFSSLAPGTYKAKAKDSNNLVSSLFSTATIAATNGVTAPNPTSATPTQITEGANSIITLAGTCSTVGSTLEWSLDNGGNWNTDATTIISTTKTFKFRCKISSTCVSSEGTPQTVGTYGGVTVTATFTNTSNCSSSDGSVTATASGGTGTGYQYALYNETGLTELKPYQSSGTFSNLANGTYKVKAKDGAGTVASSLAEATVASPDAPASPILTEYSKTINSGEGYTLSFPANACPAGSTPDWITPFINPITVAGVYKGVCKIGTCSSSPSSFTLTVNSPETTTTTSISSTNPNCFNSGGSVTATISGSGDHYYSLYNVGTGNYVAGQTEKYAGLTYTFTGITEGTYKVYIRPNGSATSFETAIKTLTKNCSGGYTISDKVLANCFGSGGAFKVTVTNPQVSGYLYTLIDAATNEIKRNEVGGTNYTFTNVRKGEYRVDITENVSGGGVLWGNERVNLTNDACANQGITLTLANKANCTGNYGSFIASVDNPTAGIGYIYTLFNTNGNQQIGQPRASGASITFNNLQAGTYRVDIVEDQINGGVIIGNNTITIESDCSDLLVDLSADGTLNCTNNGGVQLKIKSTQKVDRPNAWYRYTLYERYLSNLGTQGYRPVAKTISTINFITTTTTFPVVGPDNSWTLTDKNTWIVNKIQKTIGSAYTNVEAGDYQVDVEYIYYDGPTQINSAGRSTVLPLSNNLNAVPEITGSVCGRNDGKIKLNLTCGIGKYALALYRNGDENYVQVAGGYPNRVTSADYTFSNLAPGRYYAIVKEVGFDNVTERRNIQIDDIIVPQLSIPITITPSESAAFCPGSTVTLGISNAPVGSTYLWTGVPVGQETLASPVVTMPTTPGDYQFIARVTLGACNSGNVVREITVRVPPAISIISNSPDDGIGSIETGDPLEVTVTPVAGRTYEWKYDATNPAQWTGITIDPTIAPYNTSEVPYAKIIKKNIQVSDNGFYKVKVTDQYGCVNYNKTKVLIQPFVCKITAPGLTRCYIETNKRWADLTVTIKNRKLNWKGDIVIKRIKDLEGEPVSDNAIINYNWYTGATTKEEELTQNVKIPDGIYEVKIREKRSDEESGEGFQCEATEYITVGCQRKCKKLQPCLTGDCCGIPGAIDLNQEILLETLAIDDVVKVNDFEMIVTKIISAPVAPTYQCQIEGITKVPVFDNVFIGLKSTTPVIFNECKELVSGEIETLYNPANWDKPIQGKAIAKALYESAKDVLEALTTNPDVKVDMTQQDLANVAQQMREQAAKDLPKDLELKANEAVRKMEEARDEYAKAKAAGDAAGMAAATTKFNDAKAELATVKTETEKYLNLYQRIVQLTLDRMCDTYVCTDPLPTPPTDPTIDETPEAKGDIVPLLQATWLSEADRNIIAGRFKTEASQNLTYLFKLFVKLHTNNTNAIKDLEQTIKVYEKTSQNIVPANTYTDITPVQKLSEYIYSTMCKTCAPTTDPDEVAMVNTTERALEKKIKELFNKIVYTQD